MAAQPPGVARRGSLRRHLWPVSGHMAWFELGRDEARSGRRAHESLGACPQPVRTDLWMVSRPRPLPCARGNAQGGRCEWERLSRAGGPGMDRVRLSRRASWGRDAIPGDSPVHMHRWPWAGGAQRLPPSTVWSCCPDAGTLGRMGDPGLRGWPLAADRSGAIDSRRRASRADSGDSLARPSAFGGGTSERSAGRSQMGMGMTEARLPDRQIEELVRRLLTERPDAMAADALSACR